MKLKHSVAEIGARGEQPTAALAQKESQWQEIEIQHHGTDTELVIEYNSMQHE